MVGDVVIGAGDFREDNVGRTGDLGDCADQLDVLLVDVRNDVGVDFGEFGGGDVGVLGLIWGILRGGLVTGPVKAALTFCALDACGAAVDGRRVCIELPDTDWARFCEAHRQSNFCPLQKSFDFLCRNPDPVGDRYMCCNLLSTNHLEDCPAVETEHVGNLLGSEVFPGFSF